MNQLEEKGRFTRKLEKNLWKSFIGVFFPFALILYFIYHAIQGNHGILAWFEVEKKLRIAQEELTRLKKIHYDMDHRVRMLRPETLDPDLLDERVRSVLNLAKKEDFVVIDKK